MTGKKYNFQYRSKNNEITENVNNDAEVNVVRFDDHYCGSDFSVNVTFAENEDEIIAVFVNVYKTLTSCDSLYRFYPKCAMSGVWWRNLKQSLVAHCPDAKNDFKTEEPEEYCYKLLKKYYTVESWIADDLPAESYVNCAKDMIVMMADKCAGKYPKLERFINVAKEEVMDICEVDKNKWRQLRKKTY